MARVYRSCEWMMYFAYLNILWITFTLVGLVVFGFSPATTAMFAVTRKWVRGEADAPIFSIFWQAYKENFLRSNCLGILLFIIGYLIFKDLEFFQLKESTLYSFMTILTLMLLFLYGLILLYIFPVLVHFDVKGIKFIKNAFLVGIVSPLSTVIMIVGISLLYYAFFSIPGLIPMFSGSVVAYLIMWAANRAFIKLEAIQSK